MSVRVTKAMGCARLSYSRPALQSWEQGSQVGRHQRIAIKSAVQRRAPVDASRTPRTCPANHDRNGAWDSESSEPAVFPRSGGVSSLDSSLRRTGCRSGFSRSRSGLASRRRCVVAGGHGRSPEIRSWDHREFLALSECSSHQHNSHA